MCIYIALGKWTAFIYHSHFTDNEFGGPGSHILAVMESEPELLSSNSNYSAPKLLSNIPNLVSTLFLENCLLKEKQV